MTRFALIASLGLLLSIRASHAQPRHVSSYRVKQGDTLQLIAAEYYGDRTKAIFIMVENRITHPKPLKPGERLRIPIPIDITTSTDDTWDSLARAHLGDAKRASFLATFNNMTIEERLPAGTLLQVPFTVQHVAEATESLGSISAAYFGDAKYADMLRQYNFREKPALEKGETITIPVFHVRLQASKLPPPDAEAKARQAERRTVSTEAAKALPTAWQAWRAGDYEDIEKLLRKVDVVFLEDGPAVEVWLLRGLAHVAENKLDLAIDDFKKLRDRKPTHVIRRFDYSPKVIAAWEKAGGKVE